MATPVVLATKSYELSGGVLKEDLRDIIYDISPMDTWFFTHAGRGKAKSVTHEWLIDNLASPAANAFAEGEPFSAQANVNPTRLKNSTMITRRDFAVTGTAQKVANAGMREMLAFQTAKKAKENKRDIEFHCLNNNPHSAGTSVSPRVAGAVPNWITSGQHYKNSTQTTQSTTAPVGGFATATIPGIAASPTAYVEADLRGMLQLAWSTGGEVDTVLCDSVSFNKFSTFTGVAQRFRDVASKSAAQIIGYADVYVSPYGSHKLVLSRYCVANTAYALDMSTWEIAYLRDFQVLDSGRDGDQERRTLLAEWTLVAKTPSANAKAHGVA
jgi:hypothetical protein